MPRFTFDVVAPDADWALHCSLGLDGPFASWHMVMARSEQPLLFVRDDVLQLPRPGSREVRGSGLWADVHRHSATRWQVNFEGIALALEPSGVGRHEVGDLVPVEFEFEWEATGSGSGAVQPCMVDGEAQIGSGGVALEGPTPGSWTHTR